MGADGRDRIYDVLAEFYDNTLVTRLTNKQAGAIVLIMQRLHEDDLVGHVLEKGRLGGRHPARFPSLRSMPGEPSGMPGTEIPIALGRSGGTSTSSSRAAWGSGGWPRANLRRHCAWVIPIVFAPPLLSAPWL